MTTTFDGLRDIIVRDFELAPERLRRDTPLEEIELDSLAITELVFALEDEFHVTAGNVSPAFKNLGDIADYIDRLIVERDAAPKAARAPAKPARAADSEIARVGTKKARRPAAPKSTRVTPAKSGAAGRGAKAGVRTRGGTSASANSAANGHGGKAPVPSAARGDARPPKRKRSSAMASGPRAR